MTRTFRRGARKPLVLRRNCAYVTSQLSYRIVFDPGKAANSSL